MEYLQITVATVSEGADLVAMVLYELGSEGVSIRDDADIKELIDKKLNWDYVDEELMRSLDGRALVSGFFATDFETSKAYTALSELRKSSEIPLGSLEITASRICSADWENEWRKYYSPIHLGSIVIVPAWQKAPDTDELPVFIEPGMAFGTGNHETTSMCVELMQKISVVGKTVLDVGCGSGILGIAAAKLGAERVILSDIDEQALKAARENARLNGVTDKCTILGGDLNTGDVCTDCVVANITADILIRLCAELESVLKIGGYAIISGIINARAEDVEDVYSKKFDVVEKRCKGEWQAMLLKLK